MVSRRPEPFTLERGWDAVRWHIIGVVREGATDQLREREARGGLDNLERRRRTNKEEATRLCGGGGKRRGTRDEIEKGRVSAKEAREERKRPPKSEITMNG
ncbi:hypothetical protein Tco_0754941 [Tanacetum coccineum]